MINAPRPPEIKKPDYSDAPQGGLMTSGLQPAGEALGQALANRRQRLAEKKIGLMPTPGDQGEE